MPFGAHCPYHPLHKLLGLGAEDFILSWFLPRFTSITVFTAPFLVVPCCLLRSVPYPLPTIFLLRNSTCQPLLCNGDQQEEPCMWRLSKANHRLRVFRTWMWKANFHGLCGWLFLLHVNAWAHVRGGVGMQKTPVTLKVRVKPKGRIRCEFTQSPPPHKCPHFDPMCFQCEVLRNESAKAVFS